MSVSNDDAIAGRMALMRRASRVAPVPFCKRGKSHPPWRIV